MDFKTKIAAAYVEYIFEEFTITEGLQDDGEKLGILRTKTPAEIKRCKRDNCDYPDDWPQCSCYGLTKEAKAVLKEAKK